MSALGDIERLLGDAEGPQLLSLEAKRLRQALADAEHRGAERERAAVVEWLNRAPMLATPCGAIADFIAAGKHSGGENG